MKKVTLTILILIAIMIVYFLIQSYSPTGNQNQTQTMVENGTFKPDPSNATFTFSDGPVTLSAGKSEKAITPGSAAIEEIVVVDKFAYGDINNDKKNDTALLLARYGAGSATFIYVAAFVSGPLNYKGSQTVLIGDRIAPQSISIDNSVITVNYLDRGPDEAFTTEPTISISKQFIWKDGGLEEKEKEL